MKVGTIQRKILLLLAGGLALGLTYSPRRHFKILKAIGREWERIDRAALRRAIKRLYQSRLVTAKENPDGTVALLLSREGEKRILCFKIDEMKIKKPDAWDGKWHLVIFDIPEEKRKLRDILRQRLLQLEFIELQKSVFAHPYPCENEIEYLIEFYDLRRYVRQILAEKIDNELDIKTRFFRTKSRKKTY